ncbi:thiamine pyrophosphate-binding protein [Schleiferiaceae bacterium]|nr:thiamine pyrophosphate-binding protein [Schleiferiaceae bacterium]
MKYSDILAGWLREFGFTHYFYVGGGNIMHLTESLSNHLTGIPVIHEVAAVIASEYFNETAPTDQKAIALVTAGPGLTNTITGIAGAWLENRFVLVLGGQVKTSDLKGEANIRQRGIQEIDGVTLVSSICKRSVRLLKPVSKNTIFGLIQECDSDKKGPLFIELPLDVQANTYSDDEHELMSTITRLNDNAINEEYLETLLSSWDHAKRPILLIGGGVSRKTSIEINNLLQNREVPVCTTYNGADRIDGNYQYYFGRVNTWGQRSANIIIQKSDLIIAVGTRLGLQQTGFNWKEFGREAKIIQIDIDKNELEKGHPRVDVGICADANPLLLEFLKRINVSVPKNWIKYCHSLQSQIPRIEPINNTGSNYISPYNFIITLEQLTEREDIIIPCSSGSAFTLTMQLWQQKLGQKIVTNKSLASMGYGLSGAIGASVANPSRRTILLEGDGGFAQNMQEIGTAKIIDLNLKVFIFNDQGHASIRMTQRNYFKGKYLGCDNQTGLGLPNWLNLFQGWDIGVTTINRGFEIDEDFLEKFSNKSLEIFIVQIDPEQTYFPKIASRVNQDGGMESNPIDKMTPDIDYINK